MKKTLLLLLLLFLLPPLQGRAGEGLPRPKVGLVLGGGGAKGAAEVGVLRAIEEAGVPIDYIAGTSIGSIVGGLYSCGLRSADLDELFRSQQWLDLLTDRNAELRGDPYRKQDGITYVFGFPVAGKRKAKGKRSGPGLLRGDHVVELLDSLSGRPGPMSFDSLPIPFRCVAVDVYKMQEVVLDSGVLAEAMRASMAIPGVYQPVARGDELLIDGGALNNLPVDVVRAMGADIVIAIDLTQNKRETRQKEMSKRGGPLKKIIGWLSTRPDLKKYNENRNNCDIYINPDLENYEATDFDSDKIDEMISLGIDAGQDALPALRALAAQLRGE